jgi:hypothetical protein
MKTAPAMGKRDYSISTTLTSNSGEVFLAMLNDSQRRHITALPELQRQDLNEIVRVRREIATELRRFLRGETADQPKVLALSKRYGELDGNLSYLYATAFAKVGQALSPQQKQALLAMRKVDQTEPKGPFLYSSPISMPRIDDMDRFFWRQAVIRPDIFTSPQTTVMKGRSMNILLTILVAGLFASSAFATDPVISAAKQTIQADKQKLQADKQVLAAAKASHQDTDTAAAKQAIQADKAKLEADKQALQAVKTGKKGGKKDGSR